MAIMSVVAATRSARSWERALPVPEMPPRVAEFFDEADFPAAVFGPVERVEFSRFAWIWASLVMGWGFPKGALKCRPGTGSLFGFKKHSTILNRKAGRLVPLFWIFLQKFPAVRVAGPGHRAGQALGRADAEAD